LEPGKPVKADKSAILSDATHVVIQLRAEAQQLKDTNDSLEEKIKELKVIYLLITVFSTVRTSFMLLLFNDPSHFGETIRFMFSVMSYLLFWLAFFRKLSTRISIYDNCMFV
jgi:hypothetical protein